VNTVNPDDPYGLGAWVRCGDCGRRYRPADPAARCYDCANHIPPAPGTPRGGKNQEQEIPT
jgi:hypothetical protein